MTTITMAIAVGVLFASGVYLLLQRSPIRLVLGLGLITHGVNLLLFSTSGLRRGLPPIIMDKAAFAGDISQFVDPLPQALILTAIVISFGVTSFMVALVNRRNALLDANGELVDTRGDPFTLVPEQATDAVAYSEDDYEFLEDTRAGQSFQQQAATKRPNSATTAKEKDVV